MLSLGRSTPRGAFPIIIEDDFKDIFVIDLDSKVVDRRIPSPDCIVDTDKGFHFIYVDCRKKDILVPLRRCCSVYIFKSIDESYYFASVESQRWELRILSKINMAKRTCVANSIDGLTWARQYNDLVQSYLVLESDEVYDNDRSKS